jgi:BMFP domain-containing protein YqiC
MLKQQIIEQITEQMSNLFKNNPFGDIENNLRAILHATLDKLDLVSREEFDIQQKVLANTRSKLEELEQKIQQLESSN